MRSLFAVAILKDKNFDMVISDWIMPEMTGIELLKKIRSGEIQNIQKDIPFLLVTAESEKDNIVEAIQAGVSQYVVKPFDRVTLLEKIKFMMGDKYQSAGTF